MSNECLVIERSRPIKGEIELFGAKNAVLVIMASLLLTRGKSVLSNVPASSDVHQMISLLESLGAKIFFNKVTSVLEIDTTSISSYSVNHDSMKKMRASILVMGPLLTCFNRARVALPGGCLIGARPVDFHIKGFKKLGITVEEDDDFLNVFNNNKVICKRIVLEYPSVGATENLMMFAAAQSYETIIVNASLEPEVLDLISVLKKMGANIEVHPAATLRIKGTPSLQPIEHRVIVDRLEAGALLLAAAITNGKISLPTAKAYTMDVFLDKLSEMGHEVIIGKDGNGITLKATSKPKSVSFKTGPYPGFPTDLQAPFMVAQCVAEGRSVIEETVFENRFMHVAQLQKLGAQIYVEGSKAIVLGVEELYGSDVIATDIRASCALVLAGMVAENKTKIIGVHHWRRGYDKLEEKLILLGGRIKIFNNLSIQYKDKNYFNDLDEDSFNEDTLSVDPLNGDPQNLP